jgi:hypothetical protein
MKKYVVQLMMLLFVFCHINAMEVELNPCYLAIMSSDILNYIASFLMETEEEFIARTRIQKELTPECKNLFDGRNLKCKCWSFSPDETKLAAVVDEYNLLNNVVKPQRYLMIMNLHRNNGIKLEIASKTSLSYANGIEDYQRIALSDGGNLLATFYQNKECYEGEDFYEFIFKIKKVDAIKNYKIDEKIIDFPYDFYPAIIAFNKQGTHLITHGKDPVTQEAIYHTFSLKNIDQNEQNKENDSNKLQTYLRDKCVCNKFLLGSKKRDFSCLQ